MKSEQKMSIKVSPAGLTSLSRGAAYIGCDVRTLRKDPRIIKIRVGGKEFCRFDQLEKMARGEA